MLSEVPPALNIWQSIYLLFRMSFIEGTWAVHRSSQTFLLTRSVFLRFLLATVYDILSIISPVHLIFPITLSVPSGQVPGLTFLIFCDERAQSIISFKSWSGSKAENKHFFCLFLQPFLVKFWESTNIRKLKTGKFDLGFELIRTNHKEHRKT